MSDEPVRPVAGSEVGPGTVLNGMFRVDRLLAAGVMGVVYRGVNIVTMDPVAIEFIRKDLAGDFDITDPP